MTFELVTAAVSLGGRVTLAVIGANLAELDLSREGVDEIVRVGVPMSAFDSDTFTAALERLITDRHPDVTLMPFTVNSMSYGPAVAVSLGLGYASDVFAITNEDGVLSATRAFYGSRVHAELDFSGKGGVLLLLRSTTWAPAKAGGAPIVSELAVPEIVSRARHVEYLESPRSDVDITAAEFVLAIGRGIGPRENVAQFERLADRMGATLAVSRPLVDAGWFANGRQVGQSGNIVKPKVYLAMGISGAVQHLAGMKSSRTVIAVNTDPEAAIFGVADFGAVADLFEVARELETLFA